MNDDYLESLSEDSLNFCNAADAEYWAYYFADDDDDDEEIRKEQERISDIPGPGEETDDPGGFIDDDESD